MRYLYVFLLLIGCAFLFAQDADSLNVRQIENSDSLNIEQSIKADTTQVKQESTFNPVTMKATIDSLVLVNRTFQPFERVNKQVFMYNSEYHVAALPAQDIYLYDHGFTVRQTPFGIGYELQKRMAFTDCISFGRSISFEENLYPYPASLASTEYGIGGQDMNFAKMQIRKKELVSVDSLYGRFGALFQRGIWGGQNDNSTIEDIFLKFAAKGGNLQLHANSLDWDVPRFQYETIYAAPGYQTIREKSALVSLYWQNQWLNAGFQMSHANWTGDSLSFSGGHNFWQVLVDKEVNFKPFIMQVRYEHFGGAELYSQYNQFVTPTDLKDLGTMMIKYESSKSLLISKIYISNPLSFGYDNEWLYRIIGSTAMVLNVSGFKRTGDIQNVSIPYEKILQYSKSTIGFQFNNQYNQLYQFNFGFVTKQENQDNGFNMLTYKAEDQMPCISLVANMPFTYHKLYTIINYKLEAPYFQSTLDINAFMDMAYYNRFMFGFSQTYCDKSFLDFGMSPTSILSARYESLDDLLDAYVGLQITKQFDIRFTVKNIMNQENAFNTSLMPLTYLLSIKWDFVN